MDTDVALMNLAQEGDREAFGNLYDRYIERIYHFVYYKTFSKEIAEDITSTVFLRAYEQIARFNSQKGNVSQWLYTIARNAVIDHYRTQKVHVNVEDVFDLHEDERTEEKIDARDLLTRIEGYVRSLSPRQREIVFLRLWDELSYEEIAARVGGTDDSVKMQFSRSIRDIRQQFGSVAAWLLLTAPLWSRYHS